MATVLIGRKELFAFAERYSSRRLRDYGELADGDVLCRLFSLIFPHYAIAPASPETHSVSQRTQHNWEALHRAFARLHIPLALLQPVALAKNDTDNGFSSLVLFYFLFHLSKKTDFTAEFATDVSEALTAFLQSVDSIAALLLGEALDWEAIPEELGEVIRGRPSFHMPPAEQAAEEEAAARQCRALLAPPPPPATSPDNSFGPRRNKGHRLVPAAAAVGAGSAVVSNSPPAPVEEASATVVSSLASPDRALHQRRPPPSQPTGRRLESAEVSVTSATSVATAPVEVDAQRHHRRYVEKARECEGLRGANIALLSQVASLETALAHSEERGRTAEGRAAELAEAVGVLAEELEETHAQLADMAAQGSRSSNHHNNDHDSSRLGGDSAEVEQAIETLLAEVVDPTTGAALDAHELASLLHCMLLEHLQDSPVNRGQAQSWLWSVVTAYHELETRLVTAVDVIDSLQRELGMAEAPRQQQGVVEEGRDAIMQLTQQHETEHFLRRELERAGGVVQRTAARAADREDAWRRLCAALHRSEQLATATATASAGDLAAEREGSYAAVEAATEALAHLNAAPSVAASPGSFAVDGACAAMRLVAEQALAEKVAMAQELREARRQLADLSSHTPSQHRRATHGGYSTPMPLEQLASSNQQQQQRGSGSGGIRTNPKVVDARPANTPPGFTVSSSSSSPYGKNLSALLAEVTSPYQQIISTNAAH